MKETEELTPEQLHEKALSADDRKLSDVGRVRITLNEQIAKWTEYRKIASSRFNLKAYAHAKTMLRHVNKVLEDLKNDPEETARQFIAVVTSPEADAHRQKMAERAAK